MTCRVIAFNIIKSMQSPSSFRKTNTNTSKSIQPIVTIPRPPPTYDHRNQLKDKTVQLISERFPNLIDLAQQGTLIAIPRPEDYVERRQDGYEEPKLILLVGTAHVSQQSAKDVQRVILETKPENVVVELCKSRSSQLYENDTSLNNNGSELSLSGENLVESFQRTLALGGRTALILRILLSSLTSKLVTKIGEESTTSNDDNSDNNKATGVEFVAAQKAAKCVGAQIVLGDRPIEVTLRRAWDALPIASRWKLGWELLAGVTMQHPVTPVDAADIVEKLKDDDAVSLMLSSLSNKYPEALDPLVYERDLFISWSLKRSKAVNKSDIVVGVIGKGHVRGVCYALTHSEASESLRFRDLAGKRSSKVSQEVKLKGLIQFVVETVVVGALLEYLWDHHNDNAIFHILLP